MWVKTRSKVSAAKKIMNVLFQNEIPLDLGVPVFFLIVDEDFLPPLNDLNDGLHRLHRLHLFWVPSFELLETRRD